MLSVSLYKVLLVFNFSVHKPLLRNELNLNLIFNFVLSSPVQASADHKIWEPYPNETKSSWITDLVLQFSFY